MFTSGENMFPCPPPRPLMMDRKWKPNVELAPNCPRCDSSNTKFCYYNNYSLSQPRYFCKGCRRYWTKGGSLRNVPVGGGCRKNRRGKSIRVSTTDRVDAGSSTYSRYVTSTDLSPDDPIGNPDGTGPMTDASGADASGIDLAALYAKFLNQHHPDADSGPDEPVFPDEFDSRFELSHSSNPNQSSLIGEFSNEHTAVECQRPLDPILETQLSEAAHQMYLGEFDSNTKQKDRTVQYTSPESGEFGLQSLPGDGILPDVFWSNPMVPNIATPSLPPQGLNSVFEDHLPLHHPNLQTGNWGTFDLSCYDTFSGP